MRKGSVFLDFSREIDEFIEDLETKEATRFGRDVLDLGIRLLLTHTPRDSGYLRGQWRIGDFRVTETFDDQAVLTRARRTIRQWKPGDQVAFVNDAVYASIVDLGLFDPPDPGPSKDPRPGRRGKILVRGGYSTQAPRGMIDPVLEQLDRLIVE